MLVYVNGRIRTVPSEGDNWIERENVARNLHTETDHTAETVVGFLAGIVLLGLMVWILF